jgi:acylglycerol lipase
MTRVRQGKDFVDTMEAQLMEMYQMKFPFLAFHSRNDTMTDPEGTAMLHSRTQATDKTLVTLEKMWHGLTREDGNEELHDQMVRWTNERVERYTMTKK